MNDEILRRELRRIAIEDQHRCFGCGYEHRCSIEGCAIIHQALERLALEAPNEPLTKEQVVVFYGTTPDREEGQRVD